MRASMAASIGVAADREAALNSLRAVVPRHEVADYLRVARESQLSIGDVAALAAIGWSAGDIERGYLAGERHSVIYGDARRVAELRVQARGRVGLRVLRRELVEVWAAPLLDWLADRLTRRKKKWKKWRDS